MFLKCCTNVWIQVCWHCGRKTHSKQPWSPVQWWFQWCSCGWLWCCQLAAKPTAMSRRWKRRMWRIRVQLTITLIHFWLAAVWVVCLWWVVVFKMQLLSKKDMMIWAQLKVRWSLEMFVILALVTASCRHLLIESAMRLGVILLIKVCGSKICCTCVCFPACDRYSYWALRWLTEFHQR